MIQSSHQNNTTSNSSRDQQQRQQQSQSSQLLPYKQQLSLQQPSHTHPQQQLQQQQSQQHYHSKQNFQDSATTAMMNDTETVSSQSVLHKCSCSWKNCRAYQKAFRESRHPLLDGVVKLKLQENHAESMALKACLDRTLGIHVEWKGGKAKYCIARHHWTEKHMQKYLQDPKNFSFVKPFSVHGAHKYLHVVQDQETLQTASGELLFLQAPNVSKDAVKQEFLKCMEKIKRKKKKCDKEAENQILKDQLDAMKSQLTFLHDMVQKLQEQHFDAASVRSRKTGVPAEIELGWNTDSNAGDWTDAEDDLYSRRMSIIGNNNNGGGNGGSGESIGGNSKTTIVSASKSVKTLPREMELEEAEDDDESLEDEAFDSRSFASSYISDRGGGGAGGPMSGSRKSLGPGKPNRRSSAERSVKSDFDNNTTNGTYEVKAMVVTDPYGEKGSYTGSISSSTGMPNGYGRLEYDKAGRWYEGDWKHGRWTGQGRLSNGDGDFYQGGLKNDHKHGRGTMRFADGRTFEGEYLNGQMVEGQMTYQDGSTYNGSWVDGMRHGRGKCVFTDESVYEGEFKEGEFFGYGKMTWNDGGWYEGEWLNGDMHGTGKEVRADGSLRHDGDWLKGQPIRNNKK